MAELEDMLFLSGSLQKYPTKPPGTGFSMYALGLDPKALESSAGWYEKTYAALRQALPSQTPSAFRVLIRSYDGGPLDSGRANNRSLLLNLPPSIDPGSPAEHSLIAHEMVHVFTKAFDGDPGETGDWYSEGVADYLKLTVPYAAGLYTRAEYLQLVNAEAALYYTNPEREVSLESAAEHKWSKNFTWTIPYARGAMYFANLDARLRLSLSGLSVVDLVNEMNRIIQHGAPADDTSWTELLQRKRNGRAVLEWQQMRDGRLLIPTRGAFGDVFESQIRSAGFFSLGYLPAYHTKGSVIERVEQGSNADRAGLMPGDELLETVNMLPNASSFDLPIHSHVGRRGRPFDVLFDPHTKRQVQAWSWRESKHP